jgi:imidazolonepropionase-like amidohydrolase
MRNRLTGGTVYATVPVQTRLTASSSMITHHATVVLRATVVGACRAALLIGQASVAASATAQMHGPSVLIGDVRVFDGERVVEHRSVLVTNGKISRVAGPDFKSPGADVVDGRGRTLLPGLFDAHVHIPANARDALHQALMFGVTTQLDMFSVPDKMRLMKDAVAGDPADVSDIRTAGTGATAPGGHPTQMGGPPFPTITDPGQAQAFVDARIAEGSDYIKLVHDDGSAIGAAFGSGRRIPMLSNATMRAVVVAAHKRGKLAVVHVLSETQARDAIAAGADGLAHLFPADSVSPDFGRFAARHHVFAIPTLSTIALFCGRSPGPSLLADHRTQPYIRDEWRQALQVPPDSAKEHLCKGTEAAIRELSAAGVPILAGTDAPVPGNTYGASVHAELALLVQAGLTPLQALAAATSAPARAFRLADRGFIRPGMRADLVMVDGDPTQDILATRNIVAIWKHGTAVTRPAPRSIAPGGY